MCHQDCNICNHCSQTICHRGCGYHGYIERSSTHDWTSWNVQIKTFGIDMERCSMVTCQCIQVNSFEFQDILIKNRQAFNLAWTAFSLSTLLVEPLLHCRAMESWLSKSAFLPQVKMDESPTTIQLVRASGPGPTCTFPTMGIICVGNN